MKIGRAAHTRIWLQQKSTTKDSAGGVVEDWSDVVKLSAERREERGTERIEADRVAEVQAVIWRLRTSEEVTTDWRIRTAGTEAAPEGIQHIRSVSVIRLRPREIEIVTEKAAE